MASIHKDPRRKKGVWYCHFARADGTRCVRSTGKYSRSEAQIVCQAIQQAETELRRGDLTRDRLASILNETLYRLGETPIAAVTIGDWLNSWLEAKTHVSPATRKGYQQATREFLEFLGEKGRRRRLESIGERDIREFTARLRADGRSAATVTKLVRKFLSQAFEKARRLGRIRFNPVHAVSPEKHESAKRDIFTPEQVAALISSARNDWKGVILFAYTTSSRLSDTANLRWSSLDLEHGVASFRERKTGHESVVGLHPDFVDWLSAQPVPEDSESFVFPTLGGKRVNGDKGLGGQFDQIMTAAGIENRLIRQANAGKGRNLRALTFHSLRHTAVSAVFNSNVHRQIAAQLSGHKTGIIERYIHRDLEAIRAATKLIPRLPSNGGGK